MRLSGERLKFDRLAFDSNAAIDLLRQDRPSPLPFAEASALVMPLFVLAELRLGFSRANLNELLEELGRHGSKFSRAKPRGLRASVVRQELGSSVPNPAPSRNRQEGSGKTGRLS
jgi:hypothetical protein